MKKTLALSLLCLASLGRAETPTAEVLAAPVTATVELAPNEAALERYYTEVLSQGKLELMDSLFDPSFSSDAVFPGMKKGPDGLKEFVSKLRAAFPDASLQVLQRVSQGDCTVIRYQFSGTQKGKFLSIRPTRKKATVTGVDVWQFSNGKIIGQQGNFDSLGLLVQLGLAPELK